MALERAQKENFVGSIQENLSTAKSLVVVHYKGLNMTELTELRNQARESGVSIQITKNSLAKIALKETQFKGLEDLFKGPTAIAFSAEDEVAPSKAVVKFSKKNENLIIIGGAIGEEALDEAGVKNLASLPSLDESRAKIIGILSTPASKLACVLAAPAGQLARVVGLKPETATVAEASAEAAKEPEAEAEAVPEEEPKTEE
jgi:large subunit ribosomal protein L10